ncbi:hypothetical protein A8C32_03070 [Flavivirga aquatica]|uniref:HTTM domain-containing protein n=1 Tax=Flavivirga aquatica TaxID=1849968 RepID=A0A1E5TAM7_9FLAO|nr:hypothetical protein [Flavivirga aquatica]OEK08445.1 hypothetical protein A8C32_03070 [Flavivirga aquatica]
MIKDYLILTLKIACFCLFGGRSWQHLVWDIPIRSFLWDQELMEGIVTWLTNMSWQEYATSKIQDVYIQAGKVVLGIFYTFCAFLCFFVNEKRKWVGKIFVTSSFLLMLLALLYYKEKFFHLGQLLEYTTQITTPILLYLLVYTKSTDKQLLYFSKTAVALTFICHGLYAIGYYPQPGNFVDMVIRSLFLPEPSARIFLKVVGFIDVIIGIAIFIPVIWRSCIWYALIWGLLTAIARVTANFYVDFPWQNLNQWIPEMLYRMPHGLIPLFVLLLGNSQQLVKTEGVSFMDLISNKKVKINHV